MEQVDDTRNFHEDLCLENILDLFPETRIYCNVVILSPFICDLFNKLLDNLTRAVFTFCSLFIYI